MSVFMEVRQSISDVCKDVGFHEYATVIDSLNVPAAVVQTRDPFITYDKRFGGGATFRLSLVILVNAVNEIDAQIKLSDYLSPDSDLIQRIHTIRVPNSGYAKCLEATNLGIYSSGSGRYFGSNLSIDVVIS